MKRIILITVFLLGLNVYMFSQLSYYVVWSNTSLTYNGNPQTPTATFINQSGTPVSLSGVTISGAQTNVGGPYYAIAKPPQFSLYTLLNDETLFNITPASIPVSWSNTFLYYNGTSQAPIATATGVLNENVPLGVTGAQTNAGTHTATANILPNSNYTLSNSNATFTIYPASIYVQWGNLVLTYTGDPQTPTATLTGVLGENLPITVSGAQTNVGTSYLASASLITPNSNYKLYSESGLYEATLFSINPAIATIVWSNTSLTYTGDPQKPTATSTGVKGENIPLTVTGEQTNVGTGYTATADFTTPNNNYYISQDFPTYITTFSINRATVPVVWGNTTLTHTGSPIAPTATATGVKSENLPLTVAGAQTNVGGPYTATASLNPANGNYSLSNTTTSFTILQTVVNTYNVQWSNTMLTYTGNPQAPTAIATNSLGQTIAVTVTGTQINAGTGYNATAALTTPNPSITLTNTTTQFFISRATVPIMWGNTSLTYTGDPQTPTATATGVLGENLPLTLMGAQTNVGTGYLAMASMTTPNNNYILIQSSLSTSFSINRATVPVVWGATTLTYTGSPQKPTASATGVKNENLPLNVTGEQTNVGAGYTATAALSPTNNNYTLSNITTTFSIVQQSTNPDYAVVWSNTSLSYNGNPQKPTATVTNGQGQTLALTVNGEQTDVGTGYIATASLTTPDPSVTLSNTTTTFAITPATVPVQWGSTTLTYTGNPQAPIAYATGIKNENLPLNVTGERTNIGTGYTATASLITPNNNYTLTNTTTTFSIVQQSTNTETYTVQWGNNHLTYNGNQQAPTATATNGQGQSLALTVTGQKTDVGSGYTATAAPSVPNNNIVLINTTTQFDITPATIAVQWGITTLIYTGNPQVPSATLRGVKGEDIPLIVSGERTNAGTGYVASARPRTSNSNYVITNTTTLFSIIQQSDNNYTVQWGNIHFTYNGKPQAPTATATNSQGQSVALTVTGEQVNIGEYIATATLTVPNSEIVLINTTTPFDIASASLEIAAVSETIYYGQTPALAYTVKSGQLYGNDSLTGTLSVETQSGAPQQPPYPVDVYVIAQGTLTASSNYTINFTKGTLTVLNSIVDQFDIIVNEKSTKRRGDLFIADPAVNGEDNALIYVLANPGEIVTIEKNPQNPRTVALRDYGENSFIITVNRQNGTSEDHTLIIERYYEKVVFEYPDVPTINCNKQTNGDLTFTGFQWYRGDEPVPGATGQYYQVPDNATYHCVLTSNKDTRIRTIDVRSLALRTSGALTAYPNPTKGKVTIQQNVNESSGKTTIQVFDINGSLVMQPETNPFDMSALPKGTYLIRMNGETAKVIKVN